jgi:NAD(P)H-flavin reductase
MANAPRQDGTIDFHVRVIDGGPVSTVLARGAKAGSRLRLGAPLGTFQLEPGSTRAVVLAAGSTGLAPLKAILERAAELDHPPRTHLVLGARTAAGLYDLPDLEKLATQWPWLTVIPAVSGEADYHGETGTVADAIGRKVPLSDHDAYVCGSSPMVTETVGRLQSLGVPQDHIHVEDFGWSDS